jgi:hypothetical protein
MIALNLRDLAFLPHPTAAPSSLLTGLAGYWPLDELSGTRYDRVGTSHWIESGGPIGSAAGILGNALAPNGNPDATLMQPPSGAMRLVYDDWTWSIWFKAGEDDYGSLVLFDGDCLFNIVVYFLTVGVALQVNEEGPLSDYPTPVSVGDWHLVIVWQDTARQMLCTQVDNGAVQEAPNDVQFTTDNADPEGPPGTWLLGNNSYMLIDEVGFWKRVLTPFERSLLWNSGQGKVYPFE